MSETLVLLRSTVLPDTTAQPIRTIERPAILVGRPEAVRPFAREDFLTVRKALSRPTSTTPRPEVEGRLTLTRRGRLLLVGLPVALGIGLLIFLGAFLTSKAQAGEGPAQNSPTISVTVGAGETLWGLASQHAPDRDPRDVVAEMVELNNLGTSVVQAGQSISIPTEG